jgi:ubiquitin-like modifier-activating enzyme ATG7
MRGSLSSFSTQLLWGPAFDRCIACSPQIVNAFEQGGFDFVMAALLQPKLLEDLTGLTQIKQATDDIDLDWDENDSYDDDVKE